MAVIKQISQRIDFHPAPPTGELLTYLKEIAETDATSTNVYLATCPLASGVNSVKFYGFVRYHHFLMGCVGMKPREALQKARKQYEL